jgi:hypothetical protein
VTVASSLKEETRGESATRDKTRRGDGLPLIDRWGCVPWFLRVWLACPRRRDASRADWALPAAGAREPAARKGAVPVARWRCPMCVPRPGRSGRVPAFLSRAGAPGSGRARVLLLFVEAANYFCFLYLCASQISNRRAVRCTQVACDSRRFFSRIRTNVHIIVSEEKRVYVTRFVSILSAATSCTITFIHLIWL